MKVCTGILSGMWALLSGGALMVGPAHAAGQVIRLLDSAGATEQATQPATAASARSQNPQLKRPANFREFADATAGEVAGLQTLTLQFTAGDRLGEISSTPDFPVESGGSCVEGAVYAANTSCTLLVRFTPRGPGHRVGKLTVKDSASLSPLTVGLGGNGFAPVVSFTPAVITHVAGTYPSSVGLLKNALNLAVDGGDTLYIADTGNNTIWDIDSSGALLSLATAQNAPSGIAVDFFGDVFFTEPALNHVKEIFDYGGLVTLGGTGTDACPSSAPCSFSSEALTSPGPLSIDPYGNMFVTDSFQGAAEIITLPFPGTLVRLYDPFPFQTPNNFGFAVDASDNLYTLWHTNSLCSLVSQAFFNAAGARAIYTKVAGGRACGFSGDGGQARNAQIGAVVGQIAFDLAGNLYFSDTNNNRVRRIDAATGIIRTIAGSGATGKPSDGGSATSALLSAPTGVAVDSQGQVYIIAKTDSSAATQLVRKVGPNGIAAFGSQIKGTTSAVKMVTLANTGNAALTFTRATITTGNHADFTIDPDTTSCLLTAGAQLNSGESCQVGISFKPSATGTRSAKLTFLDNTVTNADTILLSGTGVLPAPSLKITAPVAGASFTSGTTVAFKVSVSVASGTAPTGKVTFSVDGASFGSAVTVASGAASINLTGLTVKTHTITAAYGGDANYAPVTVSESIKVTAPPTTIKPVARVPMPNPPWPTY